MMLPLPEIRDIQSYLSENEWRQSASWRGASIWSNADGHELLLPPRDDRADTGLRIRELLTVLAGVERRAAHEIALDIAAPLEDIQLFRTFPEGLPSGFTSLDAGISALKGVHSMIGAAARAVAEGPLPKYSGRAPAAVDRLLHGVRLGPSQPGSYIVTIRVPVGAPDGPFGRQTARQLHEAVTAVHAAAESAERDGLNAVEDTVTAGVSANLCDALSALAGQHRAQAFEVTFRWGRGLRSDLPAGTVRFDEGAGQTVHAAAAHLRQVRISGTAEVMGYVESLHDQPEAGDRWRTKIRGNLTVRDGTEYSRAIWVRLDGPDSYERAIAAHQDRLVVRARGELSEARGQVELSATGVAFEVIG